MLASDNPSVYENTTVSSTTAQVTMTRTLLWIRQGFAGRMGASLRVEVARYMK
jgi:hypothetical protein